MYLKMLKWDLRFKKSNFTSALKTSAIVFHIFNFKYSSTNKALFNFYLSLYFWLVRSIDLQLIDNSKVNLFHQFYITLKRGKNENIHSVTLDKHLKVNWTRKLNLSFQNNFICVLCKIIFFCENARYEIPFVFFCIIS